MTKKFNKEKLLKGCKNFAITASYAVIVVALMSSLGFAAGAAAGAGAGAAAGENDIFDVAFGFIDNVKNQLLGFSAGAVTIAVGCGVFMKKFSMGKQDKIEMGNKLIRDSIIGFVVLNSMTYITSYITNIQNNVSHTAVHTSSEAIIGFFQNLM